MLQLKHAESHYAAMPLRDHRDPYSELLATPWSGRRKPVAEHDPEHAAAWAWHALSNYKESQYQLPTYLSAAAPLKVFLNRGNWIVHCPDCNGAQLASRNDKRFFCLDCLNEMVGHLWRAIEWPEDDADPIKSEDIEAVMVKRSPKNRHWWPGGVMGYPRETLAQLLDENQKNGIR